MVLRGTNIGFATHEKRTPPFTLEGIELAKQDLLYAFMTRRGERVMRPNFGSIIFDLLFEPFDDSTKEAIYEDAVRIINEDPLFVAIEVRARELEQTVRLDIILQYVPLDIVDTLSVEYDRQNIEES
jgi:phage baseplate assembly protein W